MKAVIFAAGKGTRMGDLTRSTPKPLLRVADTTILGLLLDHLRECGFRDFVIVIGYLGEHIVRAFGDGARLGCTITYTRQSQVNGTAGAPKAVRAALSDEYFLVTFSDVVLFPEDYSRLLSMHAPRNDDGLIGVNWTEDPWYGASVVFDDTMRVSQIIEKPPRGTAPSPWNNTGLFIFSPDIFTYIDQLQPSSRGEYELTAAMQMMIDAGLNLSACRLQGPVLHFSCPEDLGIAEQIIRERAQA